MHRVFGASIIVLGVCSSAATGATYQIVDLGTLGGGSSFALDVNNNRQATGNSLVASDPGATGSLLRAYLWSPGNGMNNLGSLPDATTNRFARGFAINDSGVTVGEFNNDISRAFVYDPSAGSMSGLTRLAGDNDRGVAHDVNNSGVIVGISSNGTVSRPTKWVGGVPEDMGTIAGTPTATGRAWAVNQNGAAAGLSTNGSGTSQATLWDGGGAITNLTSLGDGSRFSQAFALNDDNKVVGSSLTGQTVGELIGSGSTTSITRAFVWQTGVIIELSPFNLYGAGNTGSDTNYHSVAMDVNNDGLIVGNSQRIAGSPAVATLWKNGQPINLNALVPAGSGWDLRSAEGINDRGDIVGYGIFGGQSRAFMLTVPEPGALGLVSVAVASFGAFRRRLKL